MRLIEMHDYIICDAGGTKAQFILFSSMGIPKAVFRSSGANALLADPETSLAVVESGIRECVRSSGTALSDITAIVLFIPGFSACLPRLKESLGFQEIHVLSDHLNASYGALGKGVGITILSGTGSFATGKDRKGNQATVGGWGPLIGDYGSGYHIGLLSLSHLTRLADEGNTGSIFESLVLHQLHFTSTEQLRRGLYQPGISRATIANLSCAVGDAAREQDTTAIHILQTAADHLADLAVMVARRIDSHGLSIALTGGVSNLGNLIHIPLRLAIAARLPQCTYIPSIHSPAIGAVLYVLDVWEGCDIESGVIVQNIKTIQEILPSC